MSISIRLLTLMILFLISFLSHAQTPNYKYQLDGIFPATLPGNLATRNIRFSMVWNESNATVKGVYYDDFFTAATPVTGTAGAEGRMFNIRLPRIIQGVSNLALLTKMSNLEGGNLPLMIYMRDQTGATLNEANISSNITIRADYVEPVPSACDVGFGSLSGYCGLYSGRISEVTDAGNICSLPDYGFKLELSADAKTNLYFYYSDTVPGVPSHTLGAFASAPVSSAANITTRHCGTLLGTNFPDNSCQTLNLSGNYIDVGAGKNFQGRYTITDENSGISCSYEMNLDREKSY